MLSQVALTNFKIFREQSIDLCPLTLLAGLNGSGKSTVIQGLAMLRQSYDTGFLSKHGWLLNGELVELGSGGDILHDNPTEGGEMSLSLAASGSPPGEVSRATFPVRYDPNGDVLLPPSHTFSRSFPAEHFNLFGVGFQYLRADRLTPSVTYPKSQYSVRTRRFLGSRGEYAAHFLLEYGDDKIGSPFVVSPDVPQADRILSQTNAWMQKFSPSVDLEVENIRQTDLVQLRYTYRTRGIGGGGGVFRATNVGFGLSYALPVVVACLSARPGDLLLIENPEAHLHPEGQLAMGDLMSRAAAGGVQVVVETHSDHVVNGIRLAVKQEILPPDQAAFRFFNRSDTGAAAVLCPIVSKDGMLSFWPSGFFTQWDDVLMKLLS